jgi:hypothetical protein
LQSSFELPDLPPAPHLPLPSAVRYVARATGQSLFKPPVYERLHSALCQGEIGAHGRKEDRNGLIIDLACDIPIDFWKQMSAQEFRRYHASECFPYRSSHDQRAPETYFANITVPSNQLDTWIKSAFPLHLSETDTKQGLKRSPRRTGTAGRPTSKDLCIERMKQLAKEGQLPQTLAKTCRVLLAWLKEEHPDAPRPALKALENSIREDYRRLPKPP